MERSGFTLPMTCTPFPGERWASWIGGGQFSVSFLSLAFVGVSLLPARPAKGVYGEGGGEVPYTVQVGRNVPVGVNNGLVAAELDDLAHDNDMLADVRVEIGAGNARRGGALHGERL